MDKNNLTVIEAELKRFSKAVALLKQRYTEEKTDYFLSGNKHTGQVKRAAQDLKRCLTDNLS